MTPNLNPNPNPKPADPALLNVLNQTTEQHFRWQNDLVTSQKVDGAKWIVLLRQPVAMAYKPIWNLVGKGPIIAAWLVALYAIGSWLVSWFYRNHLRPPSASRGRPPSARRSSPTCPSASRSWTPARAKVLEANGKFLEMAREFGGAPPERKPDDLHLRDLPNLGIDEAVERVTVSGRPFQTREQTVQDAAQRTHFLSVNLIRLQDTEQRTHGVLVLMEDATHDVETRRDLIAANTAKDQFLALLSHELRNPLSPVITMVSELDKMTDSPGARNALEIIRRNVELEARLIDDLLDITRIAHGKLQLTPEAINAHRAIHRALEICQREIDAKHLDVRLDLAATPFPREGGPGALPAGALEPDQERGKIHPQGVDYHPVGQQWQRTDRDRGRGYGHRHHPGAAGADLQAVRAGGELDHAAIRRARPWAGDLKGDDRRPRRRVQGAQPRQGPGLHLYRGTGDRGGARRAGGDSATPAITGGSSQHKILLVDDHEDTCTGMRMILERRGLPGKDRARHKKRARAGGEYPFELLISDLGLPDGTGFDLMKELRRRGGFNPRRGVERFRNGERHRAVDGGRFRRTPHQAGKPRAAERDFAAGIPAGGGRGGWEGVGGSG